MLRWLRRYCRTACKPHPLIAQFNASHPPPPSTPIDQCPLLAIDLELTGLNPTRDHIVSIGWVPIRERAVILAEARHYLVKSPVSVGQSAAVHGLHDRDLAMARPLEETLAELLATYAGYILVAHNARLDAAFLRTALKRCYGGIPAWRFLDTLRIERNRLTRQHTVFKDDGLRLNACLHRHKLPLVSSHNALEDAYSCALLLLAQISKTNRAQPLLGDLLADSRQHLFGG